MNDHLRANLWLLGLTLVICCMLYPLLLWGIGQAAFRGQADGSLIYVADGKTPIGSRLVGQPFGGDEYFQPRPSATTPAYNAAASGASNFGSNNPKLRDRVARQLGPIVEYAGDEGRHVGPDIEKWFAERTDPKKVNDDNPDLVTSWAQTYPTLASNWVNQDKVAKDYVLQWAKQHAEVEQNWRQDNPDASGSPKAEDLAVYFFASFAKANPGKWPTVEDVQTPEGKTEKTLTLVTEGSDMQATFFDSWLRAHAGVKLQEVPADMVMASGSGLDPHITLRNAKYQLNRVAEARAKMQVEALEKKEGKSLSQSGRADIVRQARQRIQALIDERASLPMGDFAIAGDEKIINVLELNIALDEPRR
jgi:K+-transporting ATPase ATPase C chain